MSALAMFPLGTVLLPGAVLPLHIFEPRYRQLVQDCLDGEPEFGVVLIERGSEVGGGDVRSMVGTVARMMQVAGMPDGRYAVITVGTRRVRINAWLPDDPYPMADISDWPDAEPMFPLGDRIEALERRVRELLAMCAELGDSEFGGDIEISTDPVLASYHLSALAPLGSADHQRLLVAPSVEARLDLLDGLLDDVSDAIQFRLGADPAADA
jgi:uncharacterized protein